MTVSCFIQVVFDSVLVFVQVMCDSVLLSAVCV